MTEIIASEEFPALARRFERWLTDHALPLWYDKGIDRQHGGFFDLVNLEGQSVAGPKRGRVQGRQSWVFALAGSMGWHGAWADAVSWGLEFALARRREDGQLPTLMASDGTVLNQTATLYDQTFLLLALAEASKHFPERRDFVEAAHLLHRNITMTRRNPAGGFVESAGQIFQSNAHMHLFEAALAWRDVEPGGIWDRLADEVAQLGLTRLMDLRGAIREFYDSDWRPVTGAAGRSVEPGHQFEWAWLLGRWARLRNDADAAKGARRLFEIGSHGVDPARGAAMDELDDDFRPVRPTARLWPQTERIKSALGFMAVTQGVERSGYRADALAAARTLWRYLETPLPGLWRDRMLPDGGFVEEPSPASSFYHIMSAIAVMKESIHD
ncbi:MAG TPA: AGE family epimerase/isomerase [Rhizomicrobium sp.]|nr:AGE family epimerase/isomerase [Rhizomicrobium sp.]